MEESNFTSDLGAAFPNKESRSSAECDDSLDLTFLLLNGLVSTFIVLGNGLACFIFLKNAHFRRCFMNTFLVSLGLADIFMALLIMPGYVIFCTSSCSESISEHCWLISLTKYLVFPATKFNLLAISYDRYIAVMQPLKYNAKINFKRVVINSHNCVDNSCDFNSEPLSMVDQTADRWSLNNGSRLQLLSCFSFGGSASFYTNSC